VSALLSNQRCQVQNLFVIHYALQFGFIFIVPLFIQNTHEDGIWMNMVHYTCQKDINVFIRDQINYIFVKTEHTLNTSLYSSVIDWLCRQQGCNSRQGEEYFLFPPCPGLTNQCGLISIGLLGLQSSKFANDHSLPSKLWTHTDLPSLSHTLSRNSAVEQGQFHLLPLLFNKYDKYL